MHRLLSFASASRFTVFASSNSLLLSGIPTLIIGISSYPLASVVYLCIEHFLCHQLNIIITYRYNIEDHRTADIRKFNCAISHSRHPIVKYGICLHDRALIKAAGRLVPLAAFPISGAHQPWNDTVSFAHCHFRGLIVFPETGDLKGQKRSGLAILLVCDKMSKESKLDLILSFVLKSCASRHAFSDIQCIVLLVAIK
jgi:hypothetical protein